jgi:hypothetical protein
MLSAMKRALVAITLVAIASPAAARAERTSVITLGITGDGRARGATAEIHWLGGARASLAFEDAPLEIPPAGLIDHDFRLTPELLAGFLSDDRHAEGYVGAGLRGELHLASHRNGMMMRTAMYVAARAIAIGKHQDGATELVVGEYLSRGAGKTRFGWEGGAMLRPRSHAQPDRARELGAIMSIYVAWQ